MRIILIEDRVFRVTEEQYHVLRKKQDKLDSIGNDILAFNAEEYEFQEFCERMSSEYNQIGVVDMSIRF